MPDRQPFTVQHLISTRRIAGYDVAPDGASAIVAVDALSEDGKSYQTNFLRLRIDRPGDATWLTRDARKKGSPRFLPSGDMAWLAEPDPAALRPPHLPAPDPARDADKAKGAEKDVPRQVHRVASGGGAALQVTDLPCGAGSFAWSQDGSRLVVLAPSHPGARTVEENRALQAAWKERKATGTLHDTAPLRHWDHWIGPTHDHVVAMDGDGGDPRDLTPGLGYALFESSLELSPDGRFAALDVTVIDENKRGEQQVELLDLETGRRRKLTGDAREHGGPRWSPDGTRLAMLAWRTGPRRTGKVDVVVVDATSGEERNLTEALDAWPERPSWVDARTLAFTQDEGGRRILRVLDVESGETRVLVDSGSCSDAKPSPDGRWIWFVHDRVDAPPELCRVGVAGGTIERLTSLNAEMAAGVALSPAESFTIPGADGTPIQLFEVRPPDFDASKRHPLLLWIHGGPIHAYADQFHFRWNAQIYAARGYVVIMVNPRGSLGFGQDFIEGNNGNWGDLCYRDLMAVADAWAARPYVDASRMAACGASFGGYMVNWIAGHETRFKCLVSHAGLFHLPAFHGTTDAGPWWELEFGGKPWEAPELYEKWSPHRFAGSFRTPTLVIHGELDYRVPLGEGLQMFLALQRQNVPSQFLYFPDENHWILKPANLVQWNETVLAWLERWL